MATERGKIADSATVAMGSGDELIVGNEQWATAEGVNGPDPAVWDNPEARNEPEGTDHGPDGGVKGPDPAVWGTA